MVSVILENCACENDEVEIEKITIHESNEILLLESRFLASIIRLRRVASRIFMIGWFVIRLRQKTLQNPK